MHFINPLRARRYAVRIRDAFATHASSRKISVWKSSWKRPIRTDWNCKNFFTQSFFQQCKIKVKLRIPNIIVIFSAPMKLHTTPTRHRRHRANLHQVVTDIFAFSVPVLELKFTLCVAPVHPLDFLSAWWLTFCYQRIRDAEGKHEEKDRDIPDKVVDEFFEFVRASSLKASSLWECVSKGKLTVARAWETPAPKST